MAEETKYEDAIAQLEDIVEKMENSEMSIDDMSKQLKKAQQLIKLCRNRLTKTNDDIKKILATD